MMRGQQPVSPYVPVLLLVRDNWILTKFVTRCFYKMYLLIIA